MNFAAQVGVYGTLLTNWWQALGPDVHLYAWWGSGVAMLLIFVFVAHRYIRMALGHSKFRGTWYTADQYRQFMQMLHEQQESKVLPFEEHQALTKFIYGKATKPVFGKPQKYGGYDA